MEFVCDCGTVHEFAADTRGPLAEIISNRGPTINVEIVEGQRYRVPRVYIAAHGITGVELPDLAERYGWAVW